MQINSFYFKNDKTNCQSTNTSKNFHNYMNLTLKSETQEINNLIYCIASWDCLGFHIVQVGNMLTNQATLPDLAFGPARTGNQVKR